MLFSFSFQQKIENKTPENNASQQIDSDSLEIQRLFNLGRSYYKINHPKDRDTSEYYLKLALDLNEKTIRDPMYDANIYFYLGLIASRKDVNQAIFNYDRVIDIAQNNNLKVPILFIRSCERICRLFSAKYDNSFKEILDYSNRGLKECDALNLSQQDEQKYYIQKLKDHQKTARAYLDIDSSRVVPLRDLEQEANMAIWKANRYRNISGGNYDSIYYFHLQARENFLQILDEVESINIIKSYLNNEMSLSGAAMILEGIGKKTSDGSNSLNVVNDLFELANSKLDTSDYMRASIFCELAERMVFIDPFKTVTLCFEGLKYFESTECLGELSFALGLLKDFERAIFYQKRDYDRFNDDYNLGLNSQELSWLYIGAGDTEQAEFYAKQALRMLNGMLSPDHPRISFSLYSLAHSYLLQDRYDEGLVSIKQAIEKFEKATGGIASYLINMYRVEANLNLKVGNLEAAKQSLKNARRSLFVSEFFPNDAYVKADAAKILIEEGKFIEALDSINLGIKLLKPSKMPLEEVAYKYDLFEIYKTKSEIFSKYYLSTQKEELLIQKFEICKEAIDLIDLIRETSSWKSSKLGILKYADDFYKEAIQTSLQLYKLNQEEEFLNASFDISEKRKSAILLEVIQNDRTNQFSQIPTELLEKEKEIQIMLTQYEKLLFVEKEKGENANNLLLRLYKNHIYDFTKSNDSLLQIINENYPQYYELNYNTSISNIEDIQNENLNEEKALIEYLYTDSIVYAFIIQKDDLEILELPVQESFKEQIEKYREGVFGYFLTEEEQKTPAIEKKYMQQMFQEGYLLYQQLFEAIEEKVKLPKQIVIIPDDILGYIPFAALNTKDYDESMSLSDMTYLVNQYQISYCYSATLLKEMQQRRSKAKKKGVLAFAPTFEGELRLANKIRSISQARAELNPLKYNIPEVEGINSFIGGKVYIGDDATEEQFLLEAADYQILHLSTHGKSNDEKGDYAYLAFAERKDSIENERLFNRDLYNLDLNAEMVVLSACETGIGELQKGEGIISLARGFSYAGAKSIITSLWSVNDAATSELMQSFYKNLKDGQQKDEALRNAQLTFIKQHKHEAHPFYWAGFIPIGDMQPIRFGWFRWWYWGILGIVGILTLIMVLRIRTKTS